MNNLGKMNAFSGFMIFLLLEIVIELEKGEKEKASFSCGTKHTFSSGSHLNAMKALGTPLGLIFVHPEHLNRFEILSLISIIALVQGQALGEEAEFTWDFRLKTPECEIKFVPQEMGIIPSWGGATQLVEIIGSRQALSQ